MEINLMNMPQGQTYEDRYQGYMDIFKRIAMTPPEERVLVIAAPWSWHPLLRHLRCDVQWGQDFFPHDAMVNAALGAQRTPMDRTTLEVLVNFRPETADALWKCDMQWKPARVASYEPTREFIVTTNGAFHRPEVLAYGEKLRVYKPTKRNVVLVPCAADKPYPAPLHTMVESLMPDDFYMMNATGVVGLVPQDLWGVMPHYDSGIPNRWRLYETVQRYFSDHEHDRIIVYCDFYSEAIAAGLSEIGQYWKATFVLPVQFYFDYVDLMKNEHVVALKKAFNR